MPVDLHIHTVASDSLWTPQALVKEAVGTGLRAFAVTDHDTDAALEETAKEAERAGLEFVRGIEFTCRFGAADVHILGYFVDRKCPAMATLLERIEPDLKRGARESAKRMREGGLPLGPFEPTGGKHPYVELVNALVECGAAASHHEAVELAVGSRSSYLVMPRRPHPSDAIAAIRSCGGISSLAHPLSGRRTMERTREEIEQLQVMGVNAVEVYSPYHDERKSEELILLCRNMSLGMTGGSDSHGGFLPGRESALATLPDWIYEQLVELHERES